MRTFCCISRILSQTLLHVIHSTKALEEKWHTWHAICTESLIYISRDKCVKDWCETWMGVFYNLIMWYIISKFRVAWKFHSISWRTLDIWLMSQALSLCLCIALAHYKFHWSKILVCNCISISTRFARARFTFLSSTTKFSTSLNEIFHLLLCFMRWGKKLRRRHSRGEVSFSIFSFHFLFWFGIWEGI